VTEFQQGLPDVFADRVQLRQAFWNLIVNAPEAMDPVSPDGRRLVIRSVVDGRDNVAITVEDSGTGIDPNNKNRIFGSFFTTKSNGIGMGLAICRLIIEAHGGHPWASHILPHGANFQVVMPKAGAAGTP
jgi:signal transduction histidine kinase